MKQKAIFWIVLALVTEKILQHGLTALLFAVNIGGIGKLDAGHLAFVGDPVMAVLNLIVMGFFVWGFWDIWKLRSRGLHLAILFSVFDIVAEFVIHGFGFYHGLSHCSHISGLLCVSLETDWAKSFRTNLARYLQIIVSLRVWLEVVVQL
ncbi:MAG TPA: hypothetical protein VF893_07455 [Candidatus Bathyarchaeia archaeon]